MALLTALLFLKEPPQQSAVGVVAAPPLRSVWRQRQALLAAGAYMALGFSFILFEETLPLYMTATLSVGGLAFAPVRIGMFTAIMGVMFTLVQLLLYHHVAKRLGYIRTVRSAAQRGPLRSCTCSFALASRPWFL